MTKDEAHQPVLKDYRKPPLRRLTVWVGASLGAFVLAVGIFISVFGNMVLDGYAKRKAEQGFARAHPGSTLRMGELNYSPFANCLVARSVILITPKSTLKGERVSLTGVRWFRFLWGTALSEVLARASLEATNLNLELPKAHYNLHCSRLRGSVPGKDLSAEGTELRTLDGDENFFAANAYRKACFHIVVPECHVSGLAYDELLQGKSYHARSVRIFGPTFETLINRDKPLNPIWERALMVNEALAAIPQPLRLDSLSVTSGTLRYCERLVVGADPGVLTISSANVLAQGIANRGAAAAAIRLQAQGELMEVGTLKVLMTIPIAPGDFSLHYSGSLGAMDLTRLDAFLDVAEHTRIKFGQMQEAAFEIEVIRGQARGHVKGIYRNLEIAMLDKQTGTEKGLDNWLASFLARYLKIRNSNAPDKTGAMKEGEVNYAKRPGEEFQQYAWFALRTGVLDIISR